MIDFLNPPIGIGSVETFKCAVATLYKERGRVLNLGKIFASIKTLDDLELYIQAEMPQNYKLQLTKKDKILSIAEMYLGNLKISCKRNLGFVTKKGEFSTNYGGRTFSLQDTFFYSLKNEADYNFYLEKCPNAIPSFRNYSFKEFRDSLKVNLVQTHTLKETQESADILNTEEEFMGEVEGVRFCHRVTIYNGTKLEITHLSDIKE